jgi:antitoxin component YwqK of YwqJK toxin-antitoxin module
MNRNLFLFTAFLCLWLSCGDTQVKENTMPSGLIEKIEVKKENGERDGNYILTTADGTIIEKSMYEDGKLEGTRTLFSDSGQIEQEEIYKNGILEGEFKSYYKDGVLKSVGKYVNNKMAGKWTYYYPSGDIKEEVHFQNNEENGPFVEYDPDGTLRARGNYANGDNEDGILYLYDGNGNPARVMKCDTGICITQWTPDSTEVSFDDF